MGIGTSFGFKVSSGKRKSADGLKKTSSNKKAIQEDFPDDAVWDSGIFGAAVIKGNKKTNKPLSKKVKKLKPKVYKVSGSFSLDEFGDVLKKTKAIHSISKRKKGNEKEYTVTFLVKTK